MKRALLLLAGFMESCLCARRTAIATFGQWRAPLADLPYMRAEFDGKDAARPRIEVALVPVAGPFSSPTDVQFVPTHPGVAIVLEQTGAARWADLDGGSNGTFFEVEVLSESEQGLLGLAFHPRFAENGLFYINTVVESDGKDVSRVAEWRLAPESDPRQTRPSFVRKILDVAQPYQNHNAGQIAFGPDGMLYVGWGDGGFAGDPHDNGQNAKTMLGSMLRIDVDRAEAGRPYAVPPDNPFVGTSGALPETWAIGLRNPWRYSFDPKGRLIAADVGQGKWEEIDIIERGKNYGWRIREGRHCYAPSSGCRTEGLADPIWEYGRDEGQSVTGGYVYTSGGVSALEGKYLFGDFATGRIWALDLPDSSAGTATAHALGRWPIAISTFGRDARGEVYVADFSSGWILAIQPPAKAPPR